MRKLLQKLKFRDFFRSQKGIVSVEMAMAMPILSALLLSGLEVTRYVYLTQKIERVSTSVSDLVAREEIITEDKVKDVFEITGQLLSPFDLKATTQVIVTSINRPTSGAATISWQRSWGGSSNGSQFGTEGANATLPTGFVVRTGENVIATEVFHDFKPTFTGDVIAASTVKKYSMYRPRFGSLANIQK